ncbi:hypothetical protein BJV74DRAFT_831415, partial [Russula compacta]
MSLTGSRTSWGCRAGLRKSRRDARAPKSRLRTGRARKRCITGQVGSSHKGKGGNSRRNSPQIRSGSS